VPGAAPDFGPFKGCRAGNPQDLSHQQHASRRLVEVIHMLRAMPIVGIISSLVLAAAGATVAAPVLNVTMKDGGYIPRVLSAEPGATVVWTNRDGHAHTVDADCPGGPQIGKIEAGQSCQWIVPAYQRIFGPARRAGCHVHLHTDGHMIELIDEIIDAGVTICNPQDLCNGIDNIKAAVDGRISIRLDIDRQTIVPFGTPREIHDHVEEAVRKLGSPRGGLELIVGIYPPTPLENVEALCAAFDKYRTYWYDGRGKA
jgi:plastocyanin